MSKTLETLKAVRAALLERDSSSALALLDAALADPAVAREETMLSSAVSFEVLPHDSQRIGPRVIRIDRRLSADKAVSWVITDGGGQTLAHDGYWEIEPMPSNRDEDYFARCRWADLGEALAFVQAHLARYPSGDREEGVSSAS